jgi:hypothetical protein
MLGDEGGAWSPNLPRTCLRKHSKCSALEMQYLGVVSWGPRWPCPWHPQGSQAPQHRARCPSTDVPAVTRPCCVMPAGGCASLGLHLLMCKMGIVTASPRTCVAQGGPSHEFVRLSDKHLLSTYLCRALQHGNHSGDRKQPSSRLLELTVRQCGQKSTCVKPGKDRMPLNSAWQLRPRGSERKDRKERLAGVWQCKGPRAGGRRQVWV